MPSILFRRLALVATLAMAPLWAPAASHAATQGECVVHSTPSFIAQGEGALAGSVADVVELGCFHEAGQPVTFEDSGLYTACGNQLKWAQPIPYNKTSGSSFKVKLDSFGNATAALWSSGCRAGETKVRATLGVPPSTVSEASFTVLPPEETPAGVYTLPANQVEGSQLTFATIVQTEFKAPRARVEVSASNFYHRCSSKPHLRWIYQGKEKSGTKSITFTLDNDGNGFAVILGGPSCSVGEGLVLAELIFKPYTEYTTSFTALPPSEVL